MNDEAIFIVVTESKIMMFISPRGELISVVLFTCFTNLIADKKVNLIFYSENIL